MRHVIASVMGKSSNQDAHLDARKDQGSEGRRFTYWIAFILVAAGAGFILFRVATEDFKRLIDLVTITSFVIAPVLVLFNHLSVTGREVPLSFRPGFLWRGWSWLCFVVTLVFALWYLLDRAGLFQVESTVVG